MGPSPPEHRLLEARWQGPVIQSFAQNAEDVRLWRVFAGQASGYYVDVGAGHPVDNSVTKLFYDAGWSGINIEPGADAALLAEARPRDTTLDIAVSSYSGSADLWIVSPYAELTSIVQPHQEQLPENARVRRETVRTARLDELVAEHAPGRAIDFLKIDVEGAEREVLASFDPRALRPRVVIVEAISPVTHGPVHDEWEPLLLESGYVVAAFDGVNRFYVPEEEAEDVIPTLAYPVSVLDRFVAYVPAGAGSWKSAFPPAPVAWFRPDEARTLQDAVDDANEAVAAMQNTLSWRVTRPLRATRRAQRRIVAGASTRRAVKGRADADQSLERALASRLTDAARLLAPTPRLEEAHSVGTAFQEVEDALSASAVHSPAKAWLLLTAVDGSYPTERAVTDAAQSLRTTGVKPFVRSLADRLAAARSAGLASPAEFDVVIDSVVVDVSQISASNLHTGIQRVARECVSRWLRDGRSLYLSCFDRNAGVSRLLDDDEAERIQTWREHLGDADETATRRPIASENILLPWSCDLALVELTGAEQSAALRGLVVSRVHRSLSLVFYDLIPFVAPETVGSSLVAMFAEYLALLKYADRVSAISRQSADDLLAFVTMLDGQGIRGPKVVEHALPTEAPNRYDSASADAHRRPPHEDPLIVVVGAHAPRKNHSAVLEAAERLWHGGARFELAFMGGTTWGADGYFETQVDRLRSGGMRVRIERNVSEARLWEAYRAARFSVFPSLIEGFGLPVAESLAVGTPVITTNYGSMAEIAARGGALTIDPRNVDDLEETMRRLLTDDVLVEALRRQARALDFGNWDDYARDMWAFFTGS